MFINDKLTGSMGNHARALHLFYAAQEMFDTMTKQLVWDIATRHAEYYETLVEAHGDKIVQALNGPDASFAVLIMDHDPADRADTMRLNIIHEPNGRTWVKEDDSHFFNGNEAVELLLTAGELDQNSFNNECDLLMRRMVLGLNSQGELALLNPQNFRPYLVQNHGGEKLDLPTT